MSKNKVETVKGYGKLTGPAQDGVHTVEVTHDGKATQLKAKNVILCTGRRPACFPVSSPASASSPTSKFSR